MTLKTKTVLTLALAASAALANAQSSWMHWHSPVAPTNHVQKTSTFTVVEEHDIQLHGGKLNWFGVEGYQDVDEPAWALIVATIVVPRNEWNYSMDATVHGAVGQKISQNEDWDTLQDYDLWYKYSAVARGVDYYVTNNIWFTVE